MSNTNEFNLTLDEYDYSIERVPSSGVVGGILKIRQRPVLSEDGSTVLRKSGVFYEVLKPQEYEESWFQDTEKLACYFLGYRYERIHFPAPNSRNWDCKSLNGEYPVSFRYSTECGKCPMNRMVNPGVSNPCRYYMSLLLLVPKPGEKVPSRALAPYILQVGPSGRKSVTAFINGVVCNYLRDKCSLPSYAVVTQIGVEHDGKFYVPRFPSIEYYEKSIGKLHERWAEASTQALYNHIKTLRADLLDRFIVKSGPPSEKPEIASGAGAFDSKPVAALSELTGVDADINSILGDALESEDSLF